MNIWKPYFICRPIQLLLRLYRQFWRPSDAIVTLPWGARLRVNPSEAIGSAIWLTGVHEVATTEAIFRLLPAGGTGVDVGANIGYMTSAMQACVGHLGSITAFEPHPRIFQELEANIALSNPSVGVVRLINVALSERVGVAHLFLDPENSNQGTATLNVTGGNGQIAVNTDTLDAMIGDVRIDVLKIDVEGHELSVLKGAVSLFSRKRIRHVIFEDHQGESSQVHAWLKQKGYEIMRIGWTVAGPKLIAEGNQCVVSAYQAPDYLATIDSDEVIRAFAADGWHCLKTRAKTFGRQAV